MQLWTVQPLTALDELKTQGVYRCQKEKSFNLSKRGSLDQPYQWLMARMREKIGGPPEGVSYPVWAWHTWEFLHQAPDPNSAAFLRRTEDKAMMTLDVPQDQAVLTDFDAWQLVLQHMYVADAREAAELDRLEQQLETLDENQLEKAIRDSWEHVFLIDRVDTDVLTRGKYIQATFWEIRPEYIRDIRVLRSL